MPKQRIKREYDLDTGVFTFTDINHNTTLDCDVTKQLWPDYAKLDEKQKRMIMEMVNDSVGDAGNAGEGDRIPKMAEKWANVERGIFGRQGGGASPRISLLAEALFNIMSRHGAKMPDGSEPTLAAVGEHLAECGDDQRKAYKARSDVDLEIGEIRKARDEAKLKEKRKAVKGQEFVPLTLG